MKAEIFVLHHHPARLQSIGDVKVLAHVFRGRRQPRAQLFFFAILRERDAVERAYIDASIAFDAKLGLEHRLHIAVQASLRLRETKLAVKAKLDLRPHIFQRHFVGKVRNLKAQIVGNVVVVRPLVNAHLLLIRFTSGGGRSFTSRPWQNWSIEIAAP